MLLRPLLLWLVVTQSGGQRRRHGGHHDFADFITLLSGAQFYTVCVVCTRTLRALHVYAMYASERAYVPYMSEAQYSSITLHYTRAGGPVVVRWWSTRFGPMAAAETNNINNNSPRTAPLSRYCRPGSSRCVRGDCVRADDHHQA